MWWMFFALASRFLWAGSNAMDQILSRAHKENKTAAVIALSFIAQAPFGVAALWTGGWPAYDGKILWWFALGIAADFLSYLPYYKCMQEEEARNIVPYLELGPVFLMILALVLRGESLSFIQAAGALTVIACGFLFSWDFTHGRLKLRVLGLMGLAAFFFALNQFAVRMVSDEASDWTVAGCFLLGQSVAGFLLLAARPQVRRSVREGLIRTRGGSAALALAEAVFSFLALLSLVLAFKSAPSTAHVAGLSGVQPFFSLFLAVLLARALPKHFGQVPFDRETKAKLFLLLGILLGAWLLAH